MSVMRYVKKPVEIEALQIFGNITEIKEFIGDNGNAYIADAAYQAGVYPPMTVVIIHTLEGDMKATDGDYIIKGVKGEFYPCRKDIFEETYNMTEDAYTKEEVIGILEEVRKQLKDMRTDYYEQAHKDVSFGINIGMEEIQRKIYKLKENIDGE